MNAGTRLGPLLDGENGTYRSRCFLSRSSNSGLPHTVQSVGGDIVESPRGAEEPE